MGIEQTDQGKTDLRFVPDVQHRRKPSFPRIPLWVEILGFLGSTAGLVLCVVVLVLSNGDTVKFWSVQPSVYLAIAITFTNILLGLALGYGLAISWWLQAISANRTTTDLHHTWMNGSNFVNAFRVGKNTYFIAVATIIAMLTQMNQPLFQRASKSIEEVRTANTSLTLRTAFHVNDSSALLNADGTFSSYTNSFLSMAQAFVNNNPVMIPEPAKVSAGETTCTGLCRTKLPAAGWQSQCSSYQAWWTTSNNDNVLSVDISLLPMTNSSFRGVQINTAHKHTPTCGSTLQITNCTLTPAYVELPIIANAYTSVISIDQSTNITGDYVNLPGGELSSNTVFVGLVVDYAPEVLAGYVQLLSEIYGQHFALTEVNGTTQPASNNMVPFQYLQGPRTGADYCAMTFANPTSAVLEAARELMFRASMDSASRQTPVVGAIDKSVYALETKSMMVFHTNYGYVAGAVAITIVNMIVTAMLFRWHRRVGLGRKLSLGVTAKFLGASLPQYDIETTQVTRGENISRLVEKDNSQVQLCEHKI